MRSKKARRVLLVTEYFLPHWTGISQAFYYLARNLQAQGYDVTVLTTQFDAALPLKEVINEIPIIRVSYQFRLSRTHYSFKILIKYLQMLSRYGAVVVNSPNSNILLYAALAKLYRKKLAIYHQGDLTLPRQTGNVLMHRFLEVIFDIMTIPAFLLCDIASTYTQDYAENSRVMKYALKKFRPYVPSFKLSDVTDRAASPASKKFAATMSFLSARHTLVGFAGRFVEEKGYDILIKVAPEVAKKIPNVLFVFAGKTAIDYEPFYEKHRSAIEKNEKYFKFFGLLSGNDLTTFYEVLDVFVIPSRSDCFPTTQIEVIQKKIPIVVTDIPGARMLVKSSGFGKIVAKDDPRDLAHGIIEVIAHKKNILKNHKKSLAFLKEYENFQLD